METVDVLVAGGGAAGYFGAITAAERLPGRKIVILEAAGDPLKKVAISGGGRCNVTQAQFDPKELVRGYPRGAQELLGAFHRFQPRDTMSWFESRGVPLKVEDDGRVFPVSDNSASIVGCLERAREEARVELRRKTKLVRLEKDGSGFIAGLVSRGEEQTVRASAVLIASGSASGGYTLAAALGHTIEPPVPSLFTFEIDAPALRALSGVSVGAAGVSLELSGQKPLRDRGPVLITHWGLSGPAVIRLSAWGARPLAEANYRMPITVSWCEEAELESGIRRAREEHPKRAVSSHPACESLPKRLWSFITEAAAVDPERTYASLRRDELERLTVAACRQPFLTSGKGVFKEEFVTCGGVRRSEVDWRTMESKIVPGLYFAGEVLDVDGITGGYNFQSAWTGGWIAGGRI